MMKTLRHTLQILGLVAALVAGTSCERRPFYEDFGGNVHIEIDLQVEPEVRTQICEVPKVYAVIFYDPETHRQISTSYVGEKGGYVNVAPGTYDILIYNYDTEYVRVRSQEHLHMIEAYTPEQSGNASKMFAHVADIASRYGNPNYSRSYVDNPVIYEPDHLYSEHIKGVNVPHSLSSDEVVHVQSRPKTIMERYTVTIGTVKNAEYISNSEIFLTGMASAKLVGLRQVSGGPAIIWFPIFVSEDHTKLFTSFLTFGSYPEADNNLFLLVHLIDASGNEFDAEWDVSDQVHSGSHDIVINCDLTIPVPTEGGMTPTVKFWDEENINVVL